MDEKDASVLSSKLDALLEQLGDIVSEGHRALIFSQFTGFHRIGQNRNVMVYRLVAKDTIEEKVMALKEKKAKLFTAVLDDNAMFASALTADDMRGLFEG